MENIINYVKPELIVVAIALYFIGIALKSGNTVKDEYIPLVLGIVGVVLSIIYILATVPIDGYQSILMSIFTGITQGFIVAGLSVYVNQLIKQYSK